MKKLLCGCCGLFAKSTNEPKKKDYIDLTSKDTQTSENKAEMKKESAIVTLGVTSQNKPDDKKVEVKADETSSLKTELTK